MSVTATQPEKRSTTPFKKQEKENKIKQNNENDIEFQNKAVGNQQYLPYCTSLSSTQFFRLPDTSVQSQSNNTSIKLFLYFTYYQFKNFR